jgi:broad specificity phosphatase PhoE
VFLWLALGVKMTREELWYNASTKRWAEFLHEQRSAGSTIIAYALRHGTTELNQDNCFRGWADVPLDDQGRKDAAVAADYLKDKGIKHVFHSDLSRAVETAHIAIDKMNTKPTDQEDERLRPWDIGELSGKDRDENAELLRWYVDNPERNIPGGESLSEFGERCQEALEEYMKIARRDGPILFVFHTSNVIQLENFCTGTGAEGKPEVDERVKPGGILTVDSNLHTEAVLKDGGKGEYGS